jgi:colanic acid biosynthesis glycosyl transferase WcaI
LTSRLLICCVNYAPEILGTAPYTRDTAEWFALKGWDVRVVTTYPYYPEWQRRPGDSRLRYRRERRGSVTVWRCPTYVPATPTGPRRVVHFASFAVTSLPVVLGHAVWSPDFILVVAPTLVSAPVALLTARLSDARSWLHVQDYEVDVAIGLGLLPSAGRTALKWLESRLLRSFDVVTSITEPMLAVSRGLGVPAERLVLLPNWARLSEVRPLDRPSRLRESLGIPEGRPVALFTGNVGRKQGIALLADAARVSQEAGSDVLYVVSGDGVGRDELAAAGRGLPNLVKLPIRPDGAFNELLNLADVHLLVQEAEVADLVMPSRLTNMLASGRPVIATAARGTALAELVRGYDLGTVVEPGDAPAIAHALDRLIDDPGRRTRQGTRAREFAETHLDRDKLLQTALGHLLARCQRRR